MALKNKKIITICLGLVLTGICFVTLVSVNRKLTNPNGTQDVIIAVKDIEKGTVVDNNNRDSLFKLEKNVDKTIVSNISIKDIESLEGVILEEDISKNEIVTEKDFISLNSTLSKIINPREISIELDSIGDGVGGLIRKGDLIDIALNDDEIKESSTILKNVYVDKALTSDGREIKRTDEDSASIINIIIDEKDVSTIESAKQKGNIMLSKIK